MSLHAPRYALPPPKLRPRSRRALAVYLQAVRERFGAANIVLLVLSFIVVLLLIVVPFYLASLLPGVGSSDPLQMFYLPFATQLWFFFEALLVTSVGAGIVANDVANRSITMYLARPISTTDYLVAKSAAVGTWLTFGIVLPGAIGTTIVLALGYVGLPTALTAYAGFVGVGLLTVVVFTGLALLLSAVAPRATYAGAALFGGLVGAEIVALALNGISGQSGVLYVSVEQDLLAVAQAAFGVTGGPIAPGVAGGVVGALAGVAFLLAYLRLGRLEVVSE